MPMRPWIDDETARAVEEVAEPSESFGDTVRRLLATNRDIQTALQALERERQEREQEQEHTAHRRQVIRSKCGGCLQKLTEGEDARGEEATRKAFSAVDECCGMPESPDEFGRTWRTQDMARMAQAEQQRRRQERQQAGEAQQRQPSSGGSGFTDRLRRGRSQ